MLEIRFLRGMRCNGLDTEFLAGANDAKGDLSAVRDQDLIEHRAVILRR